MDNFEQNLNEETLENIKVSNANTEQLDGKDLKIFDIIHSLENPRLRLGFSKLFMISRILRSSPPMGSVLYHYSSSFFRGLDFSLYNPGHGHVQDFTILDMGKFNQYFAQDTSEKMKVSNANTEWMEKLSKFSISFIVWKSLGFASAFPNYS